MVSPRQQLVQIPGKMERAGIFPDAGEVSRNLTVEQAEVLKFGACKRIETLTGASIQQLFQLLPVRFAFFKPASGDHSWRPQLEPIDQLKVDTPEQIALEFPLAGIGSRFLGLAADTILQILAYLLGLMGLIFIGPSLGIERWFNWIPASIGPAVMVLFLFCIYWGYFALFEIYWNGQT